MPIGPRMRSGRFRSKRKLKVVKRIKKPFKPTKQSPSKAMIQKVVNSMAETKYFNCTDMQDLTRLIPVTARSLANSINVLPFAVGTGEQQPPSGGTDVLNYGYDIVAADDKEIIPLNMCRAFGTTAAPSDLRRNAIDGAYCNPSLCKSEWLVEFPQESNTLASNPIVMRVVRVLPRQKKFTQTKIQPKKDLFVDQFGQVTGVDDATFNSTELIMYKVNARKYQVIQDFMQVMNPSSTTSQFAIGTGNTQVTNINNRCFSKFNFLHKQPKKLYYEETDGDGQPVNAEQPTAGQSPELIFFHFTYLGTSGSTTAPVNVEITCKPVSTFKDI